MSLRKDHKNHHLGDWTFADIVVLMDDNTKVSKKRYGPLNHGERYWGKIN